MRISVYSDSNILADTNLDNIAIINPKVEQEVNKVGKFTFTIYPEHPHYNLITKMKSIITVQEEGISEPLFRGRVYDEKEGFYNEKQVTCEGELAFLLDSIQRPWEFQGTPEELLRQLIANHNAQVDATRQFTVGIVTVTDPNNYITRADSEYKNTWDEINDKLLNTLGGYLWTRHIDGVTYIDYLADFTVLSNQTIEFGKNLLDLSKQVKANAFATALIPLGARIKDADGNDTDERLTIKSVNNNVDFVYNAEAVATHGYIYTTNIWDDVTVASNLKTKGQAYIDNMAQFTASLSVSAADLNGASINGEPVSVNSFRIGRYVRVTANPHGLDQNFIVSKLTRELLKPEATKLTLGATYKSLTEKQKDITTIKGEPGLPGKDGADGAPGKDGKGITSSVITYQASTSGTVTPTGTWSNTIPTVAANQYLWTKTVITYSDNTTSTLYTIGKMGADGAKGDKGEPGTDGAKGDTGTGIASITEEYYLSTSKTTQSGGSWSTTPPTWTKGKYMWTRSKIVYTNPASTKYTTAVCDTSWEAVNGITTGAVNMLRGSRSLTSNMFSVITGNMRTLMDENSINLTDENNAELLE